MAPRCTQDWHALAHACSTTPFALNYTVENQTNIAISCHGNTVFKKWWACWFWGGSGVFPCLSYMFLLQFHLFSLFSSGKSLSRIAPSHIELMVIIYVHIFASKLASSLTELTPLKSSSKMLYSSNCTSWLMVLHRATHRFLLIDASHHYSTRWHPSSYKLVYKP